MCVLSGHEPNEEGRRGGIKVEGVEAREKGRFERNERIAVIGCGGVVVELELRTDWSSAPPFQPFHLDHNGPCTAGQRSVLNHVYSN